MKFPVIAASLQEWIGTDDSAEFLRATGDDRRFPAEVAGNELNDIGAHARDLSCIRLENDVAALDISLDLLGARFLEDRDEITHRQFVLTAYVDSPQERNLECRFLRFLCCGHFPGQNIRIANCLVLALGITSLGCPC